MYPSNQQPNSLVSTIVAANLAPATERVAIRLLALTPEHGNITLTWDDYCHLCNRTNRNSARRHLSALVKAGLINYRGPSGRGAGDTNIHIFWPALTQPAQIYATDGASTRHEQRASAPNSDPNADLPRAVSGAYASPAARPRATDGAPARQSPHTHAVGGGGDRSTTSIPDDTTTTNQHTDKVAGWLREVGLKPKTVKIDVSLSEEEIGRILDNWERDSNHDIVGIGALFYRLAHGMTPPIVEDDEEKRRRAYIPDEYRDIIIG